MLNDLVNGAIAQLESTRKQGRRFDPVWLHQPATLAMPRRQALAPLAEGCFFQKYAYFGAARCKASTANSVLPYG